MEIISGSRSIIESLLHQGVETIFGYPGGCIMPFYDALYDYRDQLNHILTRHEQGAVHAAEGYARITGRVGVCIATSGPGATNLVTGIADAMMDSIPIVCITGQVQSTALGTDAFQETDVIGITIPITKWNYQITSPEEIPFIMAKAFAIARSGRPGPVVIDITKDAQLKGTKYEAVTVTLPTHNVPKTSLSPDSLKRAAKIINEAKKPYLLIGHGVLIAKAEKSLMDFVEKSGIPVGLTLHGLSAFPTGHKWCTGMLGMHGNYGPNKLTNKSDLLIAVGMRFDDRVTGDISSYAKGCKVIHVDIDESEINKTIPADIGLHCDAKQFFEQILELIDRGDHSEWINEFNKLNDEEYKKVVIDATEPTSGDLKMSEFISELSKETKGEAIVIADVGQHQMMAARYYNFNQVNSWITSGGLGTMGFALPAALGVKAGCKDREVVAIIGDGGFQMTCQELGTIAQEGLAVKIVILNNNFLGMVRQWQELFFDNRYSFVQMTNPDFIKLGEAFGVKSAKLEKRSDIKSAIQEMLNHNGPYLLEVVVENEQNVFPMVAAGASIDECRLE
jgi:acetolactate synthase I/II/III large subunit